MKDEEVYVDQLKRHVYVKKEHSWFGGAMSIEKYSGFLTICAPRSSLRISTFKNTKYVNTLQGMCYSGETSSATLKPENSEITSFGSKQYRSISRIVGRPNDNIIGSVNIGRFWMSKFNEIYRKTTNNIPIFDDLSKFGYAVTSGYYFHRNQPLYACADPGWNYIGQVVIVDLDGDFIPLITNLRGSDIGEFFGASLASGDLNNDGLYDLVVGAPHWGNDNGRIHIYLGSSKKEFETATILKGVREDAQFGYAVAVGDMDGDDFCNNIQDFIEPITIYASHDFMYNDSSEFCKTCPVESKNSKMKSVQVLLPFDIECGEDRICNSNICATVKLWGQLFTFTLIKIKCRENNTWIIGSNDITFETHLKNYAEPAYLTTIVFTLPKEILLRSILSFCEEDTDEDILTVICNVGNPFGTDEEKVVKLNLDMRHLTNGSLHGQVLEFFTEIRTRSTNNGTHMIKSLLILQSEAYLLLNGKAIEKSYYLPNLDSDRSNIVFQHVYQILKFGETPIEDARLVVNLPTAIDDSDSPILLNKPRIYISGKYYDCLSNGVDLMSIQQRFLGETASDASNLYNLDYNNETLQNATHDVFKRNADNYIITFGAYILQTLYILKMATSKDSNDNLTIQERDIIYVNCSSYGMNCSTIYCDLNALKTQQDIGKLVIRLILNTTKLKDNFKLSNEMKIVKINTDAYVEIIKPANRIFGMNERHNTNITTEFYNTTKTQKLQLWVVLVSVSLGLILLCIVVIILNKLDFFKRTTKEELFTLKSDEVQNKYNKIDRLIMLRINMKSFIYR
ncbi:ITA3 protein, partial [Pseudoatta argentina]